MTVVKLTLILVLIPLISATSIFTLLNVAECPPYVIVFTSKKNCANYGADYKKPPFGPGGQTGALANNFLSGLSGICEKEVCGSGQDVVGTYCARGTCDAFGRNCYGGCIAGNASEAAQRFQARWPLGEVCDVTEYFTRPSDVATVPCVIE